MGVERGRNENNVKYYKQKNGNNLRFFIRKHLSLSEKCKSRPQWGTISHQSEWLWSKSLQAINAGEGVEKREPSYTVGGNAN